MVLTLPKFSMLLPIPFWHLLHAGKGGLGKEKKKTEKITYQKK
jgi:hypothetical protein